ncbi:MULTISPECIES: hypothetical protein [Pseudomonas]|jgi:phage-related minor tail protein|uniref:Uncharacterized protein n=1 Tax=Pseudomonas tritici TaxID=2745518 RepID=A0A8I0CVC6_9PSED|nr:MULTISPECIES: hypothetical protein [Pseudomonas]AVJ40188.1 hypothetical protein CLM75_23680 [Pseudomonas lurida]MBC8980731.1 hypothetical protein [Pseudomonas lurida]MBP2871154.1 hypothetical protein [Pseudomonas sp. SWRI144]PRA14342.1 hypothetical protein CQ002_21815 [Pseudomonas sp. MYb13]PRA18123.1 hypothetical protein CQ004_23645 [Pseudomonas lurida]
MSSKNRRFGGPENTNPMVPETTPTPGPAEWQMKSLNDLHVVVGKIETSLDHLAEKLGELKEDNKQVMDRVNKVETKLVVASAVLSVVLGVAAIVGTIAATVANKAIDFGMEMAKEKMKAETPSLPAKSSK